MNWLRGLKGSFRQGELLKKHTTFKIGGGAKIFIEPRDCADLRLILTQARLKSLPLFIIGSGSNILVSDRGLNGIVLHLGSPFFKGVLLKNNYLQIGAGLSLGKIVTFAREHCLEGAEFLAGIPGTLGGALMMNAGQAQEGGSIADLTEAVTVMDYHGRLCTLSKKELQFGYRKSNLAQYVIIQARLKLKKGKRNDIEDRVKAHLKYRRQTQELIRPSAGCIFKNPLGVSAGKMIEQCGLKGKRIGDAAVSDKHANFIINLKEARAADVLKLMALIKEQVKRKFNVVLEPEIRIWN